MERQRGVYILVMGKVQTPNSTQFFLVKREYHVHIELATLHRSDKCEAWSSST